MAEREDEAAGVCARIIGSLSAVVLVVTESLSVWNWLWSWLKKWGRSAATLGA